MAAQDRYKDWLEEVNTFTGKCKWCSKTIAVAQESFEDEESRRDSAGTQRIPIGEICGEKQPRRSGHHE